MASQTRVWARRKLDMVKGNCDTAINHLFEISNTYHEREPEIASKMITISAAFNELKKGIEDIKDLV